VDGQLRRAIGFLGLLLHTFFHDQVFLFGFHLFYLQSL
jgi:hypothetical protein